MQLRRPVAPGGASSRFHYDPNAPDLVNATWITVADLTRRTVGFVAILAPWRGSESCAPVGPTSPLASVRRLSWSPRP
jgi:hypothetical protein